MNILTMVQNIGLSPKKAASTKGGEYHSPCPGCGGEDRFHVWPEQNAGQGSYWCRGCGKGGDAIQFLIDFQGLSFKEACSRLNLKMPDRDPRRAPRAPVPGPAARKDPPAAPADTRPRTADQTLWLDHAERLVMWAHTELMKQDERRAEWQWLESRGITVEVVQKWCLGWNPGRAGKDLFRPRESWGLPPELKPDGTKKKLWIPIGLTIPLYSDDDEFTRIRIRRPKGEPRYYVIPGSSMECFVTERRRRAYVIVEAELDAMLIDHHCSDLCGVIALGNSSRKPDAAALEDLRNAAVILNALDRDPAGAKAGTWWSDNMTQCRRWPVPKGKDPGEAWERGVDLREWVTAGFPRAWTLGPLDHLERNNGARGEVLLSTPNDQKGGER